MSDDLPRRRPQLRAPNDRPHVRPNSVDWDRGSVTFVINENERSPRELNTFGFALSSAAEYELQTRVHNMAGGIERAEPARLAYRRDDAIAQALGRSGDPLGPRDREYVPGDTCGLRASACQGTLRLFETAVTDGTLDKVKAKKVAAELELMTALYDAVPYFLPIRATLGVAGSEVPDESLMNELHLPFPRIAVLFGADLDLPDTLVKGDEAVVLERLRWVESEREAGAKELSAYLALPNHIHPPLFSLARGEPVRLAGVVIGTGVDGVGLDDTALWLTVIETPAGMVRRLSAGSLPCARLRPIVANLAAAVAWGDWHPPQEPLELPDATSSPEFRRALRRGNFRRKEPAGAAAMVRVLDARPRPALRQAGPGTHASPVTHNRRGFTRRQRVGPRHNWRYENRFIFPTVVNPGMEADGAVTVYRLPDPG